MTPEHHDARDRIAEFLDLYEQHGHSDLITHHMRAHQPDVLVFPAELRAVDLRAVLAALDEQPAAIIAYEPTATEQDIAKLRERFVFAQHDGKPLKVLGLNVVEIHRRTPEQRRAYLTEHRDDAIQHGIPADLIDMMIAEVGE